MSSTSTDDGSPQVLALTREFANYSERLVRSIGCSERDLWAISLAASGRMLFPDQARPGPRFPDGSLSGGAHTRYGVWRAALAEVLAILGPVEARLRTGYDIHELEAGVATFFGELSATASG